VRAQAKFELPRGTIEPSLLSFSPEQGLGSMCFGGLFMEYFAIKNWDIKPTPCQMDHMPSWASGYDVEVL
jgi:hypothetical protein